MHTLGLRWKWVLRRVDPSACVPQVEERSRLNRQSSPAMPHKVANRISDPNLPPRSESFSISGVQPARTPPLLRPVDPQVMLLPPPRVLVRKQGGVDGREIVSGFLVSQP